jgi:eukaryotic-like serine/threonine-protein kinase
MADLNAERDPLEILAAEFMERLRQGQHPDIEDYAARHPALADDIRGLFPTIAATERLKARQAQSSGGCATLGPAQLQRLGDFRLIREIGRGGMGVVFEAEQESLGRRVAVKVLPRQVLLDEKHLKRFEREARIAANLHHTNIVEVFGVGEQDGFHYYVMQYICGVGLDAVIPLLARLCHQASSEPQPTEVSTTVAGTEDALAETAARHLLGDSSPGSPGARLGPQYWQSVAHVGLQAAAALAYAHNQGVLHRDIKPANLLLGAEGTIWLADFGLAKAAQSEDVSRSRDLVGTLRYMAPEQFRGQADHRSDIYSLGLTLYELLALRPAFEETDQTRLMQRIAQGPPPSPSTARLGIPRDLETIILKAVSHDVGQRYSSAAAMAEDLRCFLEDRPIRARRASPVERSSRWCRRNKTLAGLTALTFLLLTLVAVVASIGYVRTKRALQGEALQRAKAEANADLATEALDRMFERFSPTRIRIAPQASVERARGETTDVPSSPILSQEAAALLEEMLPFYDRLARQSGDGAKLRAETAQANRRVGAIRQRLGQFDQAAQAYLRSLALYEQLRANSPANVMLKAENAQIENELGRLYTSRQRLREAREAHLAALALLQDDGALPTASAIVRFELARTYYFLGTQMRPLPAADPRHGVGRAQIPEEQRGNLAKAVALLEALSASPETNPEYPHLLALCYLEGATVEEAHGSEARGGAERAVEILEGLVQARPGIPDYAYDLSEAYARIHIPRSPILPEAQVAIEVRLGKSLALLERLVAQYPEVPDFRAAAARIHDKLGSFHRQMEHWAEAEQQFRNAIDLQAPLVKQFSDSPYFGLWMATFRIALADALIRRNQPGPARIELEETIPTLLRQLEQRPDTSRPHDLLELGYSKLAIALRQLGETDRAEEAGHKAELERNAIQRSP